MHFSNSLLMLAAMGAGNAAGRATHRHRHADLHKARDVGNIVHAKIDGVDVSWTNTYDGGNEGEGDVSIAAPPPAQPTTTEKPDDKADDKVGDIKANIKAAFGLGDSTESPTPSATAAASYPTGSAVSGDDKPNTGADVITEYTPFCQANTKRATEAQIMYAGNVGSSWGCNQMLIAADIADKYDYKIKIVGKNSEPWKVVCTNKIGPDGKLTGWYNNNAAVEFTLQPGATQYVAVDKNTQGICAAAPGDSIPLDAQGGYASTWFEFDFENESNNGWSGADISSIQAQAAGMAVQAMETCHSDICSTIYDAVAGAAPVIDNAFDLGLKLADGLGLNIPQGPAQIDLWVGGTN